MLWTSRLTRQYEIVSQALEVEREFLLDLLIPAHGSPLIRIAISLGSMPERLAVWNYRSSPLRAISI